MDGIEVDDAARLAGAQKRLRETLLCLMPDEGEYGSTLLPGFTATRWERCTVSSFETKGPVIGMVIQGCRRLVRNGVQDDCRAFNCFLEAGSSVYEMCSALPLPTRPYLSVTLDLDSNILRRLRKKSKQGYVIQEQSRSWTAFEADIGITDAFLRLVRLVENPQLFFMLAPFIVEEIHYKVLIKPLGMPIRRDRDRIH